MVGNHAPTFSKDDGDMFAEMSIRSDYVHPTNDPRFADIEKNPGPCVIFKVIKVNRRPVEGADESMEDEEEEPPP